MGNKSKIRKITLIIFSLLFVSISGLSVNAKNIPKTVSSKKGFVRYVSMGFRQREKVIKVISKKPVVKPENLSRLLIKAKYKKVRKNSFSGDYCRWSMEDCSVTSNYEKGLYKYTISGKYYESKSERDYVDKIAASIVSRVKGRSPYEKMYYLSDWIVSNIHYDQNGYTAYRALKTGGATCLGYALLFQKFAVKAGLDCKMVTGYARHFNGNVFHHAWNAVRLNGKWYYVDTTYMDNIYKDMDYFLFGSDYCSLYRTIDKRGYGKNPKVEKYSYIG